MSEMQTPSAWKWIYITVLSMREKFSLGIGEHPADKNCTSLH